MFQSKADRIILIGVYISIFVMSLTLFTRPFEFYIGYLVILSTLPFFVFKYKIPIPFIVIFSLLLINGVVNIILGDNNMRGFLKIYLGVFSSYLFYYYVIVHAKYKVTELFKHYMTGSFIVAIIGIIQFISYNIGFTAGYDYGWLLNKWGYVEEAQFGIRVNSILSEPTYMANLLSAAAFVSINNLFSKKSYFISKKKSLIILVAYLLTFSGVGYTALFISLTLLLVNHGFIKYLVFAIPVFMGLFSFVLDNVPSVRERYEGTIEIFTTGQIRIGEIHGSSIILYDNYHVTVENLKDHFFFGSGLGSHPIAFKKHTLTRGIKVTGFDNNYQDASSMLLRFTSEAGILGTLLIIFITYFFFVLRRNNNDRFWIVSNAILVMIIVSLLRQGHYFLNGFPFFVWLYIYNWYQNRKAISMNNNEELPPKLKTQLN